MNVIVYVEGKSDSESMRRLLAPLLNEKKNSGVSIIFRRSRQGDSKKWLLLQAPMDAVDILRNDHAAVVAVIPDLYPAGKGFPHRTPKELETGIYKTFSRALIKKTGEEDKRIAERFLVFCFKHDLEALVLAAEESLKTRMKKAEFKTRWRLPVEDQNNDEPPKRIVERIFLECEESYNAAVDAPLILGSVRYQTIAERCPQCFKPFVEYLEGLGESAP